MDAKFVELKLDDENGISKFKKFYDEIFVHSFPRDEIGDFDAYLNIKKNSIANIYDYKLIFVEVDGNFVAVYIFLTLPELNVAVDEFACVSPSMRGTGLGTAVMLEARRVFPREWTFAEVESDNFATKRNAQNWGFRKIPVTYTQLPLGIGRNQVSKLLLCAKHENGKEEYIPSSLVKKTVWMYYRYSQFCENPDVTKSYIDLSKECDLCDKFQLTNLID